MTTHEPTKPASPIQVSCLLDEWTVPDAAALEQLLDELHDTFRRQQRQALVVTSSRENPRSHLTVAVGGEPSVLTWTAQSDTDPWDDYCTEELLSDNGTADDEEVAFEFANQASYLPAPALISNSTARQATADYAAAGNRSTNVCWRNS